MITGTKTFSDGIYQNTEAVNTMVSTEPSHQTPTNWKIYGKLYMHLPVSEE